MSGSNPSQPPERPQGARALEEEAGLTCSSRKCLCDTGRPSRDSSVSNCWGVTPHPTPRGNPEQLIVHKKKKAIYLASHCPDLLSNYFSHLCLKESFLSSLPSVFLPQREGQQGQHFPPELSFPRLRGWGSRRVAPRKGKVRVHGVAWTPGQCRQRSRVT